MGENFAWNAFVNYFHCPVVVWLQHGMLFKSIGLTVLFWYVCKIANYKIHFKKPTAIPPSAKVLRSLFYSVLISVATQLATVSRQGFSSSEDMQERLVGPSIPLPRHCLCHSPRHCHWRSYSPTAGSDSHKIPAVTPASGLISELSNSLECCTTQQTA